MQGALSALLDVVVQQSSSPDQSESSDDEEAPPPDADQLTTLTDIRSKLDTEAQRVLALLPEDAKAFERQAQDLLRIGLWTGFGDLPLAVY